MTALGGLLRRERADEAGFTIIEALVAAAVLVIAIVLTITPLVASMRALERSKDVTIAESLAQGRIEQVRSLDFDDIGHPGAAPSGIIAASETETVEGADFRIDTTIEYVGAASGLDIVPQGGDGVEGVFDIGVNYKYVRVTVTPVEGSADPVSMETFIAPPTVGGLEDIAVVQVKVDRHEPFDPSLDPGPATRLTGPWIYDSFSTDASQYFADVMPGAYAISLVTSHGWLIHPETVDSGATNVSAVLGTNTQRTVRVFQPVTLVVEVVEDGTGLPVTDATLTATNLAYGPPITNSPGGYTFSDLVPDRYSVEAVASGYDRALIEVDVPGPGGGDSATATVRLVPQSFVPVNYTFYVDFEGDANLYLNGATVEVTHPTYGVFWGVTDATGQTVIRLPENESGFTATATTPFGHTPASAPLTTGSGPGTMSLSVTQPAATDAFELRNGAPGPDGFFEYMVATASWQRLPANDTGWASFAVPEDDGTLVQIRSFCSAADYPASPAASTSITLDGRDKQWNARASC